MPKDIFSIKEKSLDMKILEKKQWIQIEIFLTITQIINVFKVSQL